MVWNAHDKAKILAENVRRLMAQPMQPMYTPAYGTPDLGWQCPVCRTVHAPFIPSCGCNESRNSNQTS
jgi:hypothetical protein